MNTTVTEPISSDMQEMIIIKCWGASWSGVPSMERIHPPTRAPMICGMQIEQLNSPRYAPMLPLYNELVSMVNGHASIADHAHPIRTKDMNIR